MIPALTPSRAEILTVVDAAQLEAVEAENLSLQIEAIIQGDGPQAGAALRRCGAVIGLTELRYGRKLNHVVGLGMHGEVGEGDLADIERLFAERGVSVEIDLCPYAQPSLLPLLASRGYIANAFSNTYVRDLGFPGAALSPGQITVRPLASDEAEAFVGWSVAGFLQSPPRPTSLLACLARSALRRTDVDLYVAEHRGQVVGTAALSVLPVNGCLAAHLFLASTLPDFRGLGIQAALLHRRVADACEKGAAFATITARPSNSSARNAVRSSFKLAYTKTTFAQAGKRATLMT